MALVKRLRARWMARLDAAVAQRDLPSALRMPVVPSYFGLAFFAVLAVMFLWSANHQLNLGYALTFLAFTVFLLGGTITAGQLAGLSFAARGGAPVWAGDEAAFVVSVTERDGRLRGLLTLRNAWYGARCEDVLPRATAQVVLREPAQRRGWQRMAPLEVAGCTGAGVPASGWRAAAALGADGRRGQGGRRGSGR